MPSEAEFQKWYATQAANLGLDPNPDDVRHYYDWRAAHRSGAKPDAQGHWPSQFKREGHPRMVIGGVNTKTGKSIGGARVPGTAWDKRKALAARARRAATIGEQRGTTRVSPLTAAQQYKKDTAEMERKLAARRAAKKKPIKPPVAPETKPERTGRWARKLPIIGPGIAALQDVLNPPPPKKRKKP